MNSVDIALFVIMYLAIGAPKTDDHAVIVEYCPSRGIETKRELATG